MKLLGLFPGQGSQKVGMGLELCNASELAREYFSMADKALGFALSDICFQGPLEDLTATAVAQPAILTVSTICFQLFAQNLKPDSSHSIVAAAGHSLGEYSALVAAGALTFEDAVVLVHKRGSYMQSAVPVGQGKMAAILGREISEIEAAISQVHSGVVQIANVNAPGQIVIAGAREAVDNLLKLLAPSKTIELPVSAPFHCALMKPAEEKLAVDLANTSISKAQFPVYSNFLARPVSEPNEIREALTRQVCGRVRWVECMENAIRDCSPTKAVEFGYGSVLSGMLKRIQPALARINVDSPESAAAALQSE